MARESVELPDLMLFVHAVTAGSLSAAGRTLKISPAVASKRLTRLERSLGVRLVQRSSRRLSLTEEGATYYERVAPHRWASCRKPPLQRASGEAAAVQGTLSITATHAFGRRWLGPLAADFARAHPQVAVNLHLNDEVVDLLGGGFDLAVRIGQPQDSSLIARRVANSHMVLVASPAYLKKHGRPRLPADLAQHRCIALLRPGRGNTGELDFRHAARRSLSLTVGGSPGQLWLTAANWCTTSGPAAAGHHTQVDLGCALTTTARRQAGSACSTSEGAHVDEPADIRRWSSPSAGALRRCGCGVSSNSWRNGWPGRSPAFSPQRQSGVAARSRRCIGSDAPHNPASPPMGARHRMNYPLRGQGETKGRSGPSPQGAA